MAKWDDKHMYDWLGWMRSLINVHERINVWTVSPTKAYKFPIFMANNVILAPVIFFIVGLMVILKTFEWSMALLMGWVNKEMERDALDSIRGLPVIMVTLFILIPYAVTWGLPKLIQEVRQGRVERRLQKHLEILEQVGEDRRRWEHLDRLEQAREHLERQLRAAREVHDALDRRDREDFRPRKIIKLHQFGDTPKIRIFTRDEFVVTQHREGNTSTARVRSRTRRGGILE
jgi:hypothetical protein